MVEKGKTRDDATTGVTSPSHKKRKIKRYGVDSISSLPDVILQIILSFIPTKIAITTSILSKRWKRVWYDTPSLSFVCNSINADLINKTLARYTARKMTSFQLRITTKIDNAQIDKWIEFAMSRNVENMSVYTDSSDFKNFGLDNYEVPGFFYINSSFKRLKFALPRTHMTPDVVSWPSLKKLTLYDCKITRESVGKIISGCPILENLNLRLCDGIIKVLDLSKSQRLRTLKIRSSKIWQIVAPHIRYLSLENFDYPSTLVDVSSLTEANLDISYPRKGDLMGGFLQPGVLEAVKKLHNVEKLTFGATFLKILSLAELHGEAFPMFKVKDLTFRTLISKYAMPGLMRMLQNSPELKKLTVNAYNWCDIPKRWLNKYLNSHGLNSEAEVYENIFGGNKKLESKHVDSFMGLMLETTKKLEKMEVLFDGNLYIITR